MELKLSHVLEEVSHRFTPEHYKQDARIRSEKADIDKFWVLTFDRFFISCSSDARDDLLFYVKYDEKNKTDEVHVLRKDSKSLPEGSDPYILWDETLYLNLLLHEFEYHLTCCVLLDNCNSLPLSSKIKTKIAMQIYPSHTERRMDKKGKSLDVGYPNLMFCVDNFEDVFNNITLATGGEKVAVQISATIPSMSLRRLIFIGALDFIVLKRACMEKQKEKDSSYFQSMFRFIKRRSYSDHQDKYHFISMKGPNNKGHAEMAVCVSDPSCNDLEGGVVENTSEEGSVVNLDDEKQTSDVVLNTKSELNSKKLSNDSCRSKLVEQVLDTSQTSIEGHTLTPSSQGPSSLIIPTLYHLTSSAHSVKTESTNSTDLLSPMSPDTSSIETTEQEAASVKKVADIDSETLKSKSKNSKKLKQHKIKKSEEDSSIVHAYLTYVQLPWYTIAEDILRNCQEPIL